MVSGYMVTEMTSSIIQSMATVIGGSIIGLVYQWKLALVGIACMPLLISAGYIRLVSRSFLVVVIGSIDIFLHSVLSF